MVKDATGCVTVVLPPVTVTKTDGTATQLAGGDWQIDYTVTVANASSFATVYTLTDAPELGTGFSVVSGAWQGAAPAPNQAIAANSSQQYIYRVIASFDPEVEDPELECVPGQGGAFYNVASITFPGGTDSDDGCAEPGAPTVTKTAAAPAPGVGGSWTISYTVQVQNTSGMTLAYALDDEPIALPTGVDLTTPWAVTRPGEGSGRCGHCGAHGRLERHLQAEVATGTLPTGATHTYTVTAGVTLTVDADPDDLECGETPTENEGIWNTTVVSNGVFEDDAEDCVEILPVPVEVAKSNGVASQGPARRLDDRVPGDGVEPEPAAERLHADRRAAVRRDELRDRQRRDGSAHPTPPRCRSRPNATGAAAHVYTYVVTARYQGRPGSGVGPAMHRERRWLLQRRHRDVPGRHRHRQRLRRPGEAGGQQDRAAVDAGPGDRRLDAPLRGIGHQCQRHRPLVLRDRHAERRCRPVRSAAHGRLSPPALSGGGTAVVNPLWNGEGDR